MKIISKVNRNIYKSILSYLIFKQFKCIRSGKDNNNSTNSVFGSKEKMNVDGTVQMLKKHYNRISNDILCNFSTSSKNPYGDKLLQHVKKLLDYNLLGGKMNRAVILVNSYQTIASSKHSSIMDFDLVFTLGWCIELIQAFFLVLDDIMDGSNMRRNKLCWYKIPDINMIAINDGILLENIIYKLLKQYFKQTLYYTELLELFHETIWKTSLGQAADMFGESNKHNFTENFCTPLHYQWVVDHKTGHYSFYLPVCCAMLMNNIHDQDLYNKAENLLLKIGYLFQVQDDYLGFFQCSKISGKDSTDIQQGKCTWLLITALKHCNKTQYELLITNYGKRNSSNVKIVMNLYNELGLSDMYQNWQHSFISKLRQEIDELSTELPSDVFSNIISLITDRKR